MPPTSSTPNVAIGSLSLAVRLPLLGRVGGSHPLDYAHVGRTERIGNFFKLPIQLFRGVLSRTRVNKYWFLPLGNDNNFIVKEGVCYFQMFLRDYEEKDSENFWLILIGCQADENFPVIGKEYKIVVQNQIDLGNIYNSFYWSGELRDFYSGNPEFGYIIIPLWRTTR